MPRRTLLAWLCCVCCHTAGAQAVYTILAENAAGLWGQADGTGAGNDIVRAAFGAMGDTVVLEVVPYNRCKQEVLTAHALACFGMGWTEEMEGKIIFAKTPLYTNTSTFIVRKGDEQKYRKLADLPKGTRVGTVLGYEYPPQLEQLLSSRTLVPDHANTEIQSLMKLAAGRFDLAVLNLDELKSAEYMLHQAGLSETLKVAFPMESAGTYLGFSVSHPQTRAAMQDFEQGMVKIKANGALARILARWKGLQ